MSTVLVANSLQLFTSFLYILFNNILTSMLFAQEWFSYGSKRQGLRTSVPRGAQTSSYFLSLPAQYSVPLMLAFGFLHWLLSQSIFVVNVELFAAWGPPDYASAGGGTSTPFVWTLGWAWFPVFLLMILGAVIILSLIALGCRRYHSEGMPMVRTSSKAISAACHPIDGRCAEATQKRQYGVIGMYEHGREMVGFSSTAVKPLVEGGRYYDPIAWGFES